MDHVAYTIQTPHAWTMECVLRIFQKNLMMRLSYRLMGIHSIGDETMDVTY